MIFSDRKDIHEKCCRFEGLSRIIKKTGFFARILGKYVEDSNYTYWLYMTVYYPLIATFLLPCVFVLLIYFSSVTLYIFKFHR